MINKKQFPEYSVDYISNVMSLRKPQIQSIKILNDILANITLSKNLDLNSAKSIITNMYQIFSEFEHDFMSLTFALTTGVGKTKLMGAFITYLYTQKGIKNFFVVAPNLTIYKKLKNDLGNSSQDNEKYVFRGISCFATNEPNILVEDDYKKPMLLSNSSKVNIFIFNISKFNTDDRNIMNLNEYLGQSFFNYLQNLDDLVLIMDESHHYRADKSAIAINALRPILGLELTATPQVEKNNKTVLFKNVVYEYPLYKAIKDGYTRTPFALTRKDIKAYNFSDEELDKTMINDGILHHENIKAELKKYSINNQTKLVKPFALIVCRNTEHAERVLNYVKSDEFRNGEYKNKVIIVHSNQKGLEKEENINLLLDVEKNDNPVEIVIHVNILKEGWDVNNLYTIIPLRTAAGKTLREQTVGRGLRLPFGKRTGDKLIDSVTITAHDKFDELIAEAQKEDSIFKAEGVIYADYQEKHKVITVQSSFLDTDEQRQNVLSKAGLDYANDEHSKLYATAINLINSASTNEIKKNPAQKINKKLIEEKINEDIAKRFSNNTNLQKIVEIMLVTDDIVERIQDNQMFLPKIRTESLGIETYIIADFDLDTSNMQYLPIENEIIIKNMLNSRDNTITIEGEVIDFNTLKPEKYLVNEIREIGEIDYEKCPELIQKIVMQFLTELRNNYSEDKVRNICVMNKYDIIDKMKEQLLRHLAVKYDGLIEEAYGIETMITDYAIDYSHKIKNINEEPTENIASIAYTGSNKSVTNSFKFDSNSERKFAIVCDNSNDVIRWLRPAPKQFNITYNRGRRYEPDFVVETNEMYYLVEIKDKRKLNDVDVVAKKDRAIQYCKLASAYNKTFNHKEFRYLFIPHDEVLINSSFNNFKERFIKL